MPVPAGMSLPVMTFFFKISNKQQQSNYGAKLIVLAKEKALNQQENEQRHGKNCRKNDNPRLFAS